MLQCVVLDTIIDGQLNHIQLIRVSTLFLNDCSQLLQLLRRGPLNIVFRPLPAQFTLSNSLRVGMVFIGAILLLLWIRKH